MWDTRVHGMIHAWDTRVQGIQRYVAYDDMWIQQYVMTRGIRGYMYHENTWDSYMDTKMQGMGIQEDRDMGMHLMGYEI